MSPESPDVDAVVTVVRNYVTAMVFADEPVLRTTFHSSASIVGNFDGKLEWASLDDFIGEVLSVGPALPETVPAMELLSVDITVDAAAVKLVDEFAGMRFTDYLSLVRHSGGWQIVGKLYHVGE